ncbi:MAG: NFACT RNA binding domain-containing protein [Pseudothermotoga sp.]
MLVDSFVLKKLVLELRSIIDSSLRQIYQFDRSTIYLYFQQKVLRISLDPVFSHLCFTQKEDFSDHHPSTFVMLLRTRLRNARLKAVEQVGLDRIVCLDFDKIDEVGERHLYKLCLEFLGTHCNAVLVEDGLIIDAFKESNTSSRLIKRNFPYELPAQKVDPFEIPYDFFDGINEMQTISQFMSKKFYGFSKLMVQELLSRAQLPDKVLAELNLQEKNKLKHGFFSIISDFEKPYTYVYKVGETFTVSALPLKHVLAEPKRFESPSQAIEHAYSLMFSRHALKQMQLELLKNVRERTKKEKRTLDLLEEELSECSKTDSFLRYGELLKYASMENRSGNLANVLDYESGQVVSVPLVEGKDIKESSQHYFGLYKKLKEKGRVLQTRVESSRQFLSYLEQLTHTIESAQDLDTIAEIKEEMIQQGLIKAKRHQLPKESDFKRIEYEGFKILIGKNNRQNERLVRESNDKDLWLHVHESPGAHVVVKAEGKNVPRKVLEYAAALAAYHSKARFSSKVPVDYTLIKYVHKPKGSPPGLVVYTNYETIFANPQLVDSLEQQRS